MPGRRAAVVVLSAALVAGAVAGGTAAASRVDPLGLLELTGLRSAPPLDGTAGPAPAPTPTVTTTVPPGPTTTTSDPRVPTTFVSVRLGDAANGREIDVPQGWEQIDQTERWHDFLDPTLNLRLRIRLDAFGGDAKAYAEAAFAKRRQELNRFRSPGVDRATRRLVVGTTERTVTYYEFRFTSHESGGTRYGVEWYLDGSTMIGGFGWAGQLDLVEPAMVRALETLVAGDA